MTEIPNIEKPVHLLGKSADWSLYDTGLLHERMNVLERFNFFINIKTQIISYIYYYMIHYATARGAYTLHCKSNPLKLGKFVLF